MNLNFYSFGSYSKAYVCYICCEFCDFINSESFFATIIVFIDICSYMYMNKISFLNVAEVLRLFIGRRRRVLK